MRRAIRALRLAKRFATHLDEGAGPICRRVHGTLPTPKPQPTQTASQRQLDPQIGRQVSGDDV
ncbi:MAG: hypothetical protein JNM18_14020 [Planctomycetaceae bacterium]|nr:hypothetical protein [Planctomycetaceae bacterium]